MLKTANAILRFLVPLLLGGGLFWYVYRDTDLEILINHLSKIDYSWVLLSMFISLFGFYLRAFRWKLLLEPLGHKPKVINVLISLFIGFFANLLFPRLGEVTRCGYLKKFEDVNVSESFGTVISERIVDLLSFVVVAIITFLIEWEVFRQALVELLGKSDSGALSNKLLLGAIGLVIVLVSIFIVYKFDILEKAKGFIAGLMRGLLSILKLKRRVEFILSTVAIWVIYYFMLYVLFFSMESTSSLSSIVALSILTAGTVGMIVPVQSGIGTYHFFVSVILVYYGIEGNENEIFPLVSHGSQTLLFLVFGLISLVASFFVSKSKTY